MSEQLFPPAGHDRPFPWRCIECREKAIYPLAIDDVATLKHEGSACEVMVPGPEIPTCRQCGNQVFTAREDDRIRRLLRVK